MTTNPFAMDESAGGVATAAPPTAPPPAVAAPGGGDDPFSGPAPQQARGPRVRDMYGRLLLVIPHKLEEGIPNRLQPGTTQDRLTADVIVLDGGEIQFGGRPEATPPVPHTKSAPTPLKVDRMYISQRGLISQCRDALTKRLRGQPGMVLGRLTTGESKEVGQNAPYLLQVPTEEDKQVARRYLANVDPFA